MPGPRSRPVTVRVSGDWACFTRPEMKVERVTYQYPTPSAARGILEAIFWHPQFRWVVTHVAVLRPVRYQGLTRNEVQKKIPTNNVAGWMRDPASFRPFYANTRGREEGENATQRSTLALRNVAYNVTAYLVVDGEGLRPEDTPEKYVQIFERRVAAGQCFHRPYLGCREFAADFGPVDRTEPTVPDTADLGLMLYDVVFAAPGRKAANQAVFFPARIENGVIVTDPDVVLADEDQRRQVLSC
ncbi:MAG: type I-C CRISPR-associated protein Cas5 [Dehalococcoidia bacterium]|nr:type I-C CRISPR-associated protein Cas5 [Dehalococcoidia bacterium]